MAKEKLSKEQIFTELEEDIIDFFKERLSHFSIPVDLKFYFQSNKKQKQLIKMSKIPDQYAVILNKDIIVQVNAEYFDAFNTEEDEINIILFDQCIDLLSVNLDNGSFKIGSATFKASEGIVDKYSYDKVQHAQEIERLYEDQKVDAEA